MAINHQNWQYTTGGSPNIPLATDDRYAGQDWSRDFAHIQDKIGQAVMDMTGGNQGVLISGGGVTQGAGVTLNISPTIGYAAFDVTIPGSVWALPPNTQTATETLHRISFPGVANLTIPSAVLDGITINYVKLEYAELNGPTRQRAKAPGTYAYEVSDYYTVTVNNIAPTAYDVVLASFTGIGSALTISQNYPNIQSSDFPTTSKVYSQLSGPIRIFVNNSSAATIDITGGAKYAGTIAEVIAINHVPVTVNYGLGISTSMDFGRRSFIWTGSAWIFSQATQILSVSSNYNLQNTQAQIIFVTTGSSTITVTLPVVSTAILPQVRVFKVDTGAGIVNVITQGSDHLNVSGNSLTSFTLFHQGDFIFATAQAASNIWWSSTNAIILQTFYGADPPTPPLGTLWLRGDL